MIRSSFSHDEIINIRAAITSKLNVVLQMRYNKPFSVQERYNQPPVTEGEVQNLPSSMSGKSSLHDFIPTSDILTQVVFRRFGP